MSKKRDNVTASPYHILQLLRPSALKSNLQLVIVIKAGAAAERKTKERLGAGKPLYDGLARVDVFTVNAGKLTILRYLTVQDEVCLLA